MGKDGQDLVDRDHRHVDRGVDKDVPEEIDHVLRRQRVEGEAWHVQIDQRDDEHRGAEQDAEDVDDQHHRRSGNGRRRSLIFRRQTKGLFDTERRAQSAIDRENAAGDVEMQQQKTDADEQQAHHVGSRRIDRPQLAGMCGQREEKSPGSGEPADETGTENEHGADEEEHQIGDEHRRRHRHVATHEVPHHRSTAQAGDADHAGAMHGHDHVEEIRLDIDPLRLRQAHRQSEQHHQQQNKSRHDDVGENSGARADPAPALHGLDGHGILLARPLNARRL